MPVLTMAVEWLHIVCGILWMGGALFLTYWVMPTLRNLPDEYRNASTLDLGSRITKLFQVAGSGALLLGIVRGTLLGPIKSLGVLVSPYGLTWLTALLIATGLAVVGALEGKLLERVAAGGLPAPAFFASGLAEKVSTLGFLVLVGCMVMMKYGW
ncbi:MAG: hypothetical protein KGR26_03310 [Cyanobacteria bacterium REEB65]|nr:hypothetical protein [Cyanobacteria bacterium REEB65]